MASLTRRNLLTGVAAAAAMPPVPHSSAVQSLAFLRTKDEQLAELLGDFHRQLNESFRLTGQAIVRNFMEGDNLRSEVISPGLWLVADGT